MKEAKVVDIENNEKGKVKIPSQFSEEIRPDLIKRAYITLMSHTRQRYGATPMAGKRASAIVSRQRHDYRGAYGLGISRVPRKIMSRRGTRMNWVGAFAPGTVGGRRAHPPKAEKIWWQKINRKERKKAIRSAMAATLDKEIVSKRGHIIGENYPIIVDSSFEDIQKTKQVEQMLVKMGFENELSRCSKKKIRAGVGKTRGRKYKQKKGPLFVVSKSCKLIKAAANIPGVDVCEVKNVNVRLLAPGTVPGRLTVWSKAAIEIIEKEKLFL
ncbi:MAG TPA: 50S ribosomal protein L4 [Candidatus Nanoarchaeia archaeon]|nr:50S ribosomal protein L4 [Candidatus Nanoarchaeia archaeon]